MSVQVTNDVYQSHQQNIRTIYARISLLNKNNLKVGELTGQVIDGNYNFNSQSSIRRTADLKIIIADNSLIPQAGGKIWLNSRCRLEVGIMNLLTGEINYNDLGIYIIDAPNMVFSLTTKELNIKLLDLMCLLDGTRNGKLQAKTEIAIGTNISTAIQSTVQNLGGFTDVNIEQVSYTTPYLITKDVGSSIYDILKELRDMFMGYEIFIDEQGTFVFRTIPNRTTDPIAYDFSQDKDVHIDYALDLDWQNIRNDITVWGKVMSDGTQAKGIWQDTDINSPFNINTIGHIYFSVQSDNIYTADQANTRASYEGFKHGNFNDKITINCLPIYYLRENNLIYVYEDELGILGQEYIIDTIACNLKYDGKMTISAYTLGYNLANNNRVEKVPRVKRDYKPIYKA